MRVSTILLQSLPHWCLSRSRKSAIHHKHHDLEMMKRKSRSLKKRWILLKMKRFLKRMRFPCLSGLFLCRLPMLLQYVWVNVANVVAVH